MFFITVVPVAATTGTPLEIRLPAIVLIVVGQVPELWGFVPILKLATKGLPVVPGVILSSSISSAAIISVLNAQLLGHPAQPFANLKGLSEKSDDQQQLQQYKYHVNNYDLPLTLTWYKLSSLDVARLTRDDLLDCLLHHSDWGKYK